MHEISVPSFAKINWILKILGKRSDGYHELLTIFQTIDLRDSLTIEATPRGGIELEVEGRPVATGRDNLLYDTARLLRLKCGIRAGVRIRLVKRIPVGAGLGGGSGNSAVLLLALNRLWNCGLRARELADLAATLGSDVPFFLEGGTALGRGRGERLTPLRSPPAEEMILLYPGVEIGTGEAYRLGGWGDLKAAPRLTKEEVDNKISRFQAKVKVGESVRDLAENDFDAPILRRYRLLAKARQSLYRAGCDRVLLCGSGSTLLGLFASQRRDQVLKTLSFGASSEVIVCRTLSRAQYRKTLRDSGLDFGSICSG